MTLFTQNFSVFRKMLTKRKVPKQIKIDLLLTFPYLSQANIFTFYKKRINVDDDVTTFLYTRYRHTDTDRY